MTKEDKKLIVILFIVLACVIIHPLTGVLDYFVLKYFVSDIFPRLGRPKELNTAGVEIGAGVLSKRLFFQKEKLEEITDIAVGDLDPKPGIEIGFAGKKGVILIDKRFNIISLVEFTERLSHVEILPTKPDGACEYMDRGAWVEPVRLMDHNGKVLWTYGGNSVDDMCKGDLDGDGKTEFAVGFNGGSGIHLLDQNGKVRWSKPDTNVWHVEIGTTPGESSRVIVHTNGSFFIRIRDKEGRILNEAKPDFEGEVTKFTLCRWPGDSSPQRILYPLKDSLCLIEFQGQTVARLAAPKCNRSEWIKGVPVKLKQGELPYLAVLVDFGYRRRALLYVYAPDGTLIYEEILPETCEALGTLPVDGTKTEAILVGGEGKVWEFK